MNGCKIRCVIIEDEQHTTRLMENYVSQIQQLECLGSFITPLELLEFDRREEVQIIYLDIQTPGMTGLDFLKIKPPQAEVIFTTAYSQYAIEGYDLDVTDYLLKPVEFPRFYKATQKAIKQIELNQVHKQKSIPETGFIMLKVDKKLVRIKINDIIYVQSDWNYVHVYTAKKRYVVLSSMKSIETTLNTRNFFRIHRSYLINLKHFEYIEGNMVKLHGVNPIPVSRNIKDKLIKLLD